MIYTHVLNRGGKGVRSPWMGDPHIEEASSMQPALIFRLVQSSRCSSPL